MAILGLLHVNIVCRDLDRSLAFYTDVVGARLLERVEAPHDPVLAEALQLDDTTYRAALLHLGDSRSSPYLDLLEWTDGSESRPQGASGLGAARIAIAVDDIHEEYARIRHIDGVEPLSAPGTAGVGRWQVGYFCFRDPDGFLVEYVEVAGRSLSSS